MRHIAAILGIALIVGRMGVASTVVHADDKASRGRSANDMSGYWIDGGARMRLVECGNGNIDGPMEPIPDRGIRVDMGCHLLHLSQDGKGELWIWNQGKTRFARTDAEILGWKRVDAKRIDVAVRYGANEFTVTYAVKTLPNGLRTMDVEKGAKDVFLFTADLPEVASVEAAEKTMKERQARLTRAQREELQNAADIAEWWVAKESVRKAAGPAMAALDTAMDRCWAASKKAHLLEQAADRSKAAAETAVSSAMKAKAAGAADAVALAKAADRALAQAKVDEGAAHQARQAVEAADAAVSLAAPAGQAEYETKLQAALKKVKEAEARFKVAAKEADQFKAEADAALRFLADAKASHPADVASIAKAVDRAVAQAQSRAEAMEAARKAVAAANDDPFVIVNKKEEATDAESRNAALDVSFKGRLAVQDAVAAKPDDWVIGPWFHARGEWNEGLVLRADGTAAAIGTATYKAYSWQRIDPKRIKITEGAVGVASPSIDTHVYAVRIKPNGRLEIKPDGDFEGFYEGEFERLGADRELVQDDSGWEIMTHEKAAQFRREKAEKEASIKRRLDDVR